jgi:N-acetylglutamate synthase-like GNAT family acetyltransferase
MKNVIVQVYTEGYRQQVCDLILHIQRNEFGVPITLEDQPDLSTIPSFYQKGTGNFWIALCDEKVVGTIALIDIGHAETALRKMFVHQDFRGGEFQTGQRLLDTAIRWMEERQVQAVTLGTLEKFTAAQRFYRRNEFEEVAKEDLPSYFPRMPLDNKFFRKRITATNIEIMKYQPEHQPWFEKLNRAWIEQFFWMEPIDFEVLQHPDVHILNKGGDILMASFNKEIAGAAALKYVEPGVYEFTKMAVDEKFRGKKIGRTLVEASIDRAKKLGAKKVILYSNTRLTTAIQLYRKVGFYEVPVDAIYKRSDIKMELPLSSL